MVRRVVTGAMLAVLVFMAVGCGGEEEEATKSAGKVAVVDFREIISQVGKQEEVEQQVQQIAGVYQERINELQQQLQDLGAELEGQPVEGNEEKIQQYREAEQELRAVLAEGRQRINATRQQLYNDFGEQLKPVASKIARERGFSVILSSTVTFYSTDAVDITEEVIDELVELMKRGEFKPSVPEPTTTPEE
ncbi:MAG: OmpH family outer membrane protein [Phycisphaerae bacterium]